MTEQKQARNLAERYRPKTLKEMVGQETVVRTLRSLIDGGWMDGGFIFEGPTGTGKTTAARALARELNIDMTWDYVEVKATECTVEMVRKIKDNARFAPLGPGGYRVWLVDEAHVMSREAVNAWKTLLEDLYPRRVVIFATTDTGSAFARDAALRDRCTPLEFQPATPETIRALVTRVAKSEGLKVDVDSVVQRAGQSYRRALRALQGHATRAAAGLPQEPAPATEPAPAPVRTKPAVQYKDGAVVFEKVKLSMRGHFTECVQCGAKTIHARGLCRQCYGAFRRRTRHEEQAVAAG